MHHECRWPAKDSSKKCIKYQRIVSNKSNQNLGNLGKKLVRRSKRSNTSFPCVFHATKDCQQSKICIAHGRRSPFELSGTLVVIEELCLQSCAKELPKVFQASGFHNDMYSQYKHVLLWPQSPPNSNQL